ncbi:MAG: hypothetical protein U0271_10615 [Polyangiaceae bacterium]
MIRSPWDGANRSVVRVALACVLGVDVIGLAISIAETPASAVSHPMAPRALLALGGRPLWVAPLALATLGALFVFARKRSFAAGVGALVLLAALAEAQAALLDGPMRVFFTSGAVLLGWLLGTAIAGRAPVAERDRFAEAGAVGALAATYANAATSKLLASGISWADANTLRAIVLTQRGLGEGSPLSFYARAVVEHPNLAYTLAAATLIIQATALFYPWTPLTRAVWGTLLIGFHLNVWALTPIVFPQAMALLALFSYPWPRLVARLRVASERAPIDDADVGDARRRLAIAGAVWFALAAAAVLLPIRRYTQLHHHRTPPSVASTAPETPVEPAPADVLALVAPLVEGGTLEGYTIERIEPVRERSFKVKLAREGVSFELEVMQHGTRPALPPKSTARYDLYYGHVTPAEDAATRADIERLLTALSRVVRQNEARVSVPMGL